VFLKKPQNKTVRKTSLNIFKMVEYRSRKSLISRCRAYI
jgi:hypothetical protein